MPSIGPELSFHFEHKKALFTFLTSLYRVFLTNNSNKKKPDCLFFFLLLFLYAESQRINEVARRHLQTTEIFPLNLISVMSVNETLYKLYFEIIITINNNNANNRCDSTDIDRDNDDCTSIDNNNNDDVNDNKINNDSHYNDNTNTNDNNNVIINHDNINDNHDIIIINNSDNINDNDNVNITKEQAQEQQQ